MDAVGIIAALESHAASLGCFERVNGHEPDNAPGSGLTAAVWLDFIGPFAPRSGLAVTSAVLRMMVRVYASAQQDPPDAIDPAIIAAVDSLMTAYSGDFDLGGLVANVDLVGQTGAGMSAQAGWLPFPDGSLFRVMTITVPLIVNDAWPQAA